VDDTVAKLVRRAGQGDAGAFEQIIERFERTTLSVSYAIVGSADVADDIVQESFVRAWERMDELASPERFAGWFLEIVRNLSLDHRRRRGVERAGAARVRPPGPVGDPPGEACRHEDEDRVARALGELDDESRQIVVLRYYDGLSSREIGECVSLSPAAVDMRLSRARAKLREMLGEGEESKLLRVRS
jgi:RNA polymerase sigma-70 factor (ECF subfamily)